MKKLVKPSDCLSEIIDNCISSLRSPNKDLLKRDKKLLIDKAKEYNLYASNSSLFMIKQGPSSDYVTKDNMEYLYKNKFVNKHSSNRKFYDSLMNASLDNICPICRYGRISTLDHYLPKALYPAFTLTQFNLIPECFDCNHTKLEKVTTLSSEQLFHPYYDNFDKDIWLKAKIIKKQSQPIYCDFFAEPGDKFSETEKKRIIFSFSEKGYNLKKVYQEIGSKALRDLKITIEALLRANSDIKKFFYEYIEKERKIELNSLKAALYTAILEYDCIDDLLE